MSHMCLNLFTKFDRVFARESRQRDFRYFSHHTPINGDLWYATAEF